MDNWQEFAYNLRLKCPELTWQQLADTTREWYPNDFTGDGFDKVRSYLKRRLKREHTNSIACLPIPSIQTALLQHGAEQQDDLITPKSILENSGLDAGLWKLTSYRTNGICAKPVVQPVLFEEVSKHIRELDWDSICNFKHTGDAVACSEDGEILEICLPDLHSGLLSWWRETGKSYDLKIAEKHFWIGINDIIKRCYSKSIKKIYFVTLGDLLHVDNDENKTSKGTFQNADGRIMKIFSQTLKMLIEAIKALSEIAPVEVVYLSGNHDRVLGGTLLVATEMAFRNIPNITFDTEPNPQKWRLIGETLIGWTHGDMPNKNLGFWLQDRAKKEYGMSKYAEVHCGHLHTQGVKEIVQTEDQHGVIVRRLPSICPSSLWEYQQGYSNGEKTVMSFLWNEQNGLRDIWYSNI